MRRDNPHRSIITFAVRGIRARRTFRHPEHGLYVPDRLPAVDMQGYAAAVERYRDAAVVWPPEHADGQDDAHIRRFLVQAEMVGMRGEA